MMTSLFSSFDPCSSDALFTNWMSTIIMLLMLPSVMWFNNNRFASLATTINKTMHLELKNLIHSKTSFGSTFLLSSIFIYIMFNNLLGLFPYLFTSTSHLVTALTLAMPIWLAFMLFGWINSMNHMFAHMTPTNTPNLLLPFMVMIETTSNLIRPCTLTVRLSANIIAGHLLMTLLANQATNIQASLVSVILMIQILLILLESAVAMIQAYVLIVLSTLYTSEIIFN